jgi:hypothetical protein
MHDEVTPSQERIYQNRHSATYGYERGKRSTSRCCQVLWPIRMREYPRVPRELKLPPEFVLYSLRHTALTRLENRVGTPSLSCESPDIPR